MTSSVDIVGAIILQEEADKLNLRAKSNLREIRNDNCSILRGNWMGVAVGSGWMDD